MANSILRATLDPELLPLRKTFQQLLPLLDQSPKHPDWYGSIYFERKHSRSQMANLRATNVSSQVTIGAVLRIYDGYTLFEQATDDLDPSALTRTAQEFADRVGGTPPSPGALKRPYEVPSWSDRLAFTLDPEITSQIPAGVSAETPVHFGVRFERDPARPSTEQRVTRLKGLVERFVAIAIEEGMKPDELSFVMARGSFAEEESIFIDRETNLSQTLYRMALTLVTMSSADRIGDRVGGLGGLEATEVTEEEMRIQIRKLRALKTAERLIPGKYRVLVNPGIAGVIAHEAFGHSQEGDTCARGRSKAWELHKAGESVGNELATILNSPAIYKNGATSTAAWGSYFFDEEGWLAQEHVILDRGKLKSPMTNLTSAIRLGIPRTANGKRENWSQGVYTRQTNTYFSAGDKTLDQMMKLLGDGFIATECAGGMEDPKGMGIQVGIQYLEEVKGGKKSGRVFKGPAGGDIQLTGYTPDVLNAILAKSKIEFDSASPDQAQHPTNDTGGCGKYHKEFVFAGCGGPWMLLDPIMLG